MLIILTGYRFYEDIFLIKLQSSFEHFVKKTWDGGYSITW